MSAYWLTYKPLNASSPRGWPASKMTALVDRFETDPESAQPVWRIASHQSAHVGDRVYLFKQGSDPRGIFGFGEIVEAPALLTDESDIEEGPRFRAKIRFDRLVDPGQSFLLDYEAFRETVPENLIFAQASGTRVPEDVEFVLERLLSQYRTSSPPIGIEEGDDPRFDKDSFSDERERALRAIRIRRGQPAFRAALLRAYGGRCAVTGCSVEDVLEAAHITPYLGSLTNVLSNGLLLRTDIHTLFDCKLLAFEPIARRIVIAKALQVSSYAKFAGKTLRSPTDAADGPSRRNLEKNFSIFSNIGR